MFQFFLYFIFSINISTFICSKFIFIINSNTVDICLPQERINGVKKNLKLF